MISASHECEKSGAAPSEIALEVRRLTAAQVSGNPIAPFPKGFE
jgi:hypothetical protein